MSGRRQEFHVGERCSWRCCGVLDTLKAGAGDFLECELRTDADPLQGLIKALPWYRTYLRSKYPCYLLHYCAGRRRLTRYRMVGRSSRVHG